MSHLRALCLILLAVLCLTGCVQYDVGIDFANQTQGKITQHIRLGDQLTSFSSAVAQDWLQSIKQRTRDLGGSIRQVSNQELVVTIPFHNGADLTKKFNTFFQSAPQQSPPLGRDADDTGPEISPELRSQLNLTQSNWLLVERDRLSYDLDLRPLGVISASGNLLISPGSLLNLEFSLNAPWGVRSLRSADNTDLQPRQQGNRLIWTLNPGTVNHLEAVFWVPSPLGIGTVAIALLVAGGIYLRSQLFPLADPSSKIEPASSVAPEV